MSSHRYDSNLVANDLVPNTSPPVGYGNYYATYYSPKYTDPTKWPVLQVKYLVGRPVDTSGAVLVYNSTINCTSVTGGPAGRNHRYDGQCLSIRDNG